MNNKELYQKTFSRLHASEDLEMEEIIMKKKKFRLPKMAACLAAAFVLTSILGVGAYAAVSGDFFGTVKVLFNGEEKTVDFYQQEDGSLLGTMGKESDQEEDVEYYITTDRDLDSLSEDNDSVDLDITLNTEDLPKAIEED